MVFLALADDSPAAGGKGGGGEEEIETRLGDERRGGRGDRSGAKGCSRSDAEGVANAEIRSSKAERTCGGGGEEEEEPSSVAEDSRTICCECGEDTVAGVKTGPVEEAAFATVAAAGSPDDVF